LIIFPAVIMKKDIEKNPSIRTKGFFIINARGCYNIFRPKGTVL